MENHQDEGKRLFHAGEGSEREPGWYVRTQREGAGSDPAVLGPCSFEDAARTLRSDLGRGREAEADEILQKAVSDRSLELLDRTTEPTAGREQIVLNPDASGRLAEIPPGVSVDENKRTITVRPDQPTDVLVNLPAAEEKLDVTLDGEHAGDIHMTGEGTGIARRMGTGRGDAYRDGEGFGWACRMGPGEGSAYRAGGGDGNAIRGGEGDGCAFRSGSGTGLSSRSGDGIGCAVSTTSGRGDAVVMESARGIALRGGAGSGDAVLSDQAEGKAVRAGTGPGAARLEMNARGVALVDRSGKTPIPGEHHLPTHPGAGNRIGQQAREPAQPPEPAAGASDRAGRNGHGRPER